MNNYYVYMTTNKYNTVLYIGVTNNLARRIYEHKNKLTEGFCAKYNLKKLVYFELVGNYESAICREKQLKKYSRAKKEQLIAKLNPEHNDLYETII